MNLDKVMTQCRICGSEGVIKIMQPMEVLSYCIKKSLANDKRMSAVHGRGRTGVELD